MSRMRPLGFLVALSIGLSGCIELFQQDLAAEEAGDVPRVEFRVMGASDSVDVIQAPAGVEWSEYNVTGNRSAVFRLNDGIPRTFGPTHPTQAGSGRLTAGDMLEFCAPNAGALQIRLLHTPTNTVVFEHHFPNVDRHPWCR